jgi:ABC-2 type transport system permease protein
MEKGSESIYIVWGIMKKYLSITVRVLSMSVQRLLEFRKNFVLWSTISTSWAIFSLLFYSILFGQTKTIAGWSQHDMYLLIGTYMIIDSFTWTVFWNPIRMYVDAVFNGTLDFFLIKPADDQFLLTMQRISFSNITRILIGIYLVATHLESISILQLFVYVFFIICSLVTIYSVWFITATFSLWAERLNNIKEIVPTLRNIWSVPAEVYSGFVGAILTIVVPLALITTTPTRVLLHEFRLQEIFIFITMSVVMFSISRIFFFFSIKRYASASS